MPPPAAGELVQAAEAKPGEFAKALTPYIKNVAGWLVAQAGSFGMMMIHFLLTLIFSALLYMNGEMAAEAACKLARRIEADLILMGSHNESEKPNLSRVNYVGMTILEKAPCPVMMVPV